MPTNRFPAELLLQAWSTATAQTKKRQIAAAASSFNMAFQLSSARDSFAVIDITYEGPGAIEKSFRATRNQHSATRADEDILERTGRSRT